MRLTERWIELSELDANSFSVVWLHQQTRSEIAFHLK